MRLVLGIDSQFIIERVAHVDVREHTSLVVLDHLLAFDVESVPLAVEQADDQLHAVRKQVDVDVRALADMAGHDAADQPGLEPAQQAHEAQSVQAHVAQMLGARLAFLGAREDLNEVADFGVGREIVGLEMASAEPFRGLALRGEVLGLHAVVH